MFDIGFSELLLFGVIALIVLGPEKLPQAARTAGQWYAKLRRAAATIQTEIEAELDLAETRQQMQKELAKIRQTEADMRREMAELRGNMQAFESSKNQNPHSNIQPASDKDVSEPSMTQNNSSSPQQASHHKTATADELEQTASLPIMTRPWENMWFRLGAYDKARRLPAAPRLPNYQADVLLYTQKSYSQPHNQPNPQQPLQQPNESHHSPTPACASQQEAAE